MAPPQLTPLAQSLPRTVPFVGPEALERRAGTPFRARLGANESGFGPAKSVIAALTQATGEVWKYGDPELFDLRHALAAHLGVAPDQIAVGEGIDGLLGLICRLYLNPGDVVVTSLGAYPTFNFHVAGFGGRLVTVPYRADHEDLAALADTARRERAAIVYLSNPDNPMGTFWPAAEIEAFLAAVPEQTLIVLDEAYGETAPPGTLPPLAPEQPNLIRLRTFSKAYGLAGLRCGYAIAPAALIGAFESVRNHFGVNRLAQIGALAALADQAWLADVVERTAAARQAIADLGRAQGLVPIASGTNFVTLDCGRDGAFAARVLAELGALGIFVRKPMAPGLDRCIRVSAGTPADLAAFAQALPLALAAARGPA